MPNTKSAKKYVRQTGSRTGRNNFKKVTFRKAVRAVEDLVKEEKKEDAAKAFTFAQKALDKAVKVNVISKNTAARKKARLSRKIKEMK